MIGRFLHIFVACAFFFIPLLSRSQGPGYALDLDGIDDHADMGDIHNDLVFPFTVSAWIYWEGPQDGSNSEFAIVTADNHPGRNILFIQTGVYSGFTLFVRANGSINMRIGDGGRVSPNSRRDKWSPPNVIPLNRWTHVVGVVRGLTDMDLYVNGIDVGGIYDGDGGNMDFGDSPFVIGRYTKDRSNGEEYFFNGQIEEVRLWNYSRTEPEIRNDMCHRLTGTENGLIGYWEMNSGAGNALQGSSPNALGGTLQNADLATVWALSGAPIGDQSVQVYTGDWNAVDIDLPFGASSFRVDQILGNAQGVHLYGVAATPNHLNGVAAGEAPYGPYFGTFAARGNNVPFAGSYQVNIEYDPANAGACDPDFSLYQRDHNADPTWSELLATANGTELSFFPLDQRGEFLLTHVPCDTPDTPICVWEDLRIALEDTALCSGEETTFSLFIPPTNTSNIFLATWEWDFGDGTNSTELNPTHGYTNPGNYTVNLALTDLSGCDTLISREININDSQVPEFSFSPDTNICAGNALILEANSLDPTVLDLTYQWLPSGETSPSISIQPSQNQVYTVEIGYACGSITHSIGVGILPGIEASATTTPASCVGLTDGQAQVNISSGQGPFTYTWNGPGVTSINGSQWEVDNLPAGNYEVLIADVGNCNTRIDISIAEPADPLSLTLDSLTPDFCGDSTGNASVSATGGNPGDYSYLWDLDTPLMSPQAEGLTSGMYQVVVSDELGCSDSLRVEIPLVSAPQISTAIQPSPSEEISFDEAKQSGIVFQVKSPDAERYEWDLGDSTFMELAEFVHFYQEPGTYTVTLKAFTEEASCFSQEEFLLTLVARESLFSPSAFSPNGDGINDEYFIQSLGSENLTANIYDRWGNRIAELSANRPSWDGMLPNGAQAPEGVYVVKISAQFDSHVHTQTHSLTLIR